MASATIEPPGGLSYCGVPTEGQDGLCDRQAPRLGVRYVRYVRYTPLALGLSPF